MTRSKSDLWLNVPALRGEVLGTRRGEDSWELEGTSPRFFMPIVARFGSASAESLVSARLEMKPDKRTRRSIDERAAHCAVSRTVLRRRTAKLHTRGFTLIEAMVVITITALAAGLILLAVESTVQTADDASQRTIATGMAQQIIDEALGGRYAAAGAGPYQYPLVANSWELNGNGRERFDDTDDYNGFLAVGAEDIWGRPLGQGDDQGGLRHPNFRADGTLFSNWIQMIEVFYVSDNNLSNRLPAGQASNHRAVEVTILRQQPNGSLRELAKLRRVYAYIPPLQ